MARELEDTIYDKINKLVPGLIQGMRNEEAMLLIYNKLTEQKEEIENLTCEVLSAKA